MPHLAATHTAQCLTAWFATPLRSGIVDPKAAPATNTTHAFTSSHNANRPVHMQNYPITELEMELAQAQTKLQKLRRQHDRLSYTARERQRELDELHRTIAEREEQDAYNEACMEAGEAMMLELESRLSRVRACPPSLWALCACTLPLAWRRTCAHNFWCRTHVDSTGHDGDRGGGAAADLLQARH